MIVFGIYCPETNPPHADPDPVENIHKLTSIVVSTKNREKA